MSLVFWFCFFFSSCFAWLRLSAVFNDLASSYYWYSSPSHLSISPILHPHSSPSRTIATAILTFFSPFCRVDYTPRILPITFSAPGSFTSLTVSLGVGRQGVVFLAGRFTFYSLLPFSCLGLALRKYEFELLHPIFSEISGFQCDLLLPSTYYYFFLCYPDCNSQIQTFSSSSAELLRLRRGLNPGS